MDIKPPFDTSVYKADLQINQQDLSGAFAEHASLFAYYAECEVKMLRQESQAKQLLEIIEAKLYKAARDEAIDKAEKYTEGSISAVVVRTPEYVKAAKAYNEAKAMTALAHSAVEAFRHRKDMLVQMGASERQERQGELTLSERASRVASQMMKS